MQIARSLTELAALPAKSSVVTIGNFDGVHCGHRRVIAALRERAQQLGARSVAVTFDPHPAHVLHSGTRLPLITPLAVKLELLAASGLDLALVLPFTDELRQWPARRFAELSCATGCIRSSCMKAKPSASATMRRPMSLA
jgi:riboflavin kinase/FMN adenylyltransferase